MAEHDVVVIGAGHNGLTIAAYLAKAGLNVCVLEQNSILGGATSTAEVTLPGFKHELGAVDHALIQANPMILHDELGLKSKYGLKYIYPKLSVANVFPDDTYLGLYADLDKTCESIAQFSEHDAEAYRKFYEMCKPMIDLLVGGLFNAPPPFGALISQLDQTPIGQELVRSLMMSAYDVISQWFEHPKTKLKLLKYMSEPLVGPEDRGTAVYLFVLIPMNHTYPLGLPEGGSGMLPASLARCVEANGGTVKVDSEVKKIKTSGGRASSVVLASGEEIKARKAVVANVDARVTLLQLLEDKLSDDLKQKVERIQDPSFTGILQAIALNNAPEYKAAKELREAYIIEPLPWLEEFRRLFDDLRYGEIPSRALAPFVVCPTVHDPTRAPAGKHTLYLWNYVPYWLKDGGPEKWDSIKEKVADTILDWLRKYATNMGPENILGRAIYSPLDFERMNPNLVHGAVLGPGAFMYQFFSYRPIPELGQYRTPIDKLYLAGHATHPGGCVTGGGRATVQVIMDDLGIDFEKAIT